MKVMLFNIIEVIIFEIDLGKLGIIFCISFCSFLLSMVDFVFWVNFNYFLFDILLDFLIKVKLWLIVILDLWL